MDPNEEAIEAWNTVLFDKFVRFRHVVATGLGTHGDAALARHSPRQAVTFERNDAPISIGRDLDDAIEFAMAPGPAGEVVRLAGEEGERLRPRVIDALRKVLARFVAAAWSPRRARGSSRPRRVRPQSLLHRSRGLRAARASSRRPSRVR